MVDCAYYLYGVLPTLDSGVCPESGVPNVYTVYLDVYYVKCSSSTNVNLPTGTRNNILRASFNVPESTYSYVRNVCKVE